LRLQENGPYNSRIFFGNIIDDSEGEKINEEKKFHVWVVNEALIPPLLQAESAAWYLFSFVYGSSYIMFLFVLFLGHIINSNVTCLHR
jgi:hypothetical protein